MNIFKKLGRAAGLIPDNPTEEIMEKRSQIKIEMANKLAAINFTEDEINSVLSILDKSEKDIQAKKDELIGTNINNDNTAIIMKKIFGEIREIEVKAGEDMKQKIYEIKKSKGV